MCWQPENQLQSCALFENLGDGTFRRGTAFPDLPIHGTGAAWADYDGDGFLDIVVSGYQSLLLFHNEPSEGGVTSMVPSMAPTAAGGCDKPWRHNVPHFVARGSPRRVVARCERA